MLISVIGLVDSWAIVWLEGLCQQKIPMIPSGIKPVNFQLVAQSPNQLCHREPQQTHITQFTFASTQYGMTVCDTHKFCT